MREEEPLLYVANGKDGHVPWGEEYEIRGAAGADWKDIIII